MTTVVRSSHGFIVTFNVTTDLSQLTEMRVGIKPPKGATEVLREIDSSVWSALTAGDTLALEIADGDLDANEGTYLIQLYGRRVEGQDVTLDLSSHPPLAIKVDDAVVVDRWRTLP